MKHTVMPYTRGPASFAAELGSLPEQARQAFEDRLEVLVSTLTGADPMPPLAALDVVAAEVGHAPDLLWLCLLYTSPSPRDGLLSRMPSSA